MSVIEDVLFCGIVYHFPFSYLGVLDVLCFSNDYFSLHLSRVL